MTGDASNQAAGPTGELPRIAMTMGDVAGIGPEVVARAIADPRVNALCRPLVVGHPDLLRRALKLIGEPREIEPVRPGRSGELDCGEAAGVPCWNPGGDDVVDVPAGTIDARAGRAAHDWLVAAAQAARNGQVDAITTAPLHKAALNLAGLNVPGHTEILAAVCGVDRYAMMLFLPHGGGINSPQGLGIAHVTLHTSIASVPGLLSQAGIADKIVLVADFMAAVGCGNPRVGVCALNPHAGEQGLFGDEEARLIAPAVEQQHAAGIDVSGPIPADALIRRAVAGEFDGVVAMYHDQGHIPFKLIGFDRAVNVTLGLPLVRTSPSHGTAFDIAWQGKADHEGFVAAVDVAARLSARVR